MKTTCITINYNVHITYEMICSLVQSSIFSPALYNDMPLLLRLCPGFPDNVLLQLFCRCIAISTSFPFSL